MDLLTLVGAVTAVVLGGGLLLHGFERVLDAVYATEGPVREQLRAVWGGGLALWLGGALLLGLGSALGALAAPAAAGTWTLVTVAALGWAAGTAAGRERR